MTPLIERGIDVNLRDSGGATALMYTAFCGHAQVIELLLSAGANPFFENEKGEKPFHIAHVGQALGPLLCENTQEENGGLQKNDRTFR